MGGPTPAIEVCRHRVQRLRPARARVLRPPGALRTRRARATGSAVRPSQRSRCLAVPCCPPGRRPPLPEMRDDDDADSEEGSVQLDGKSGSEALMLAGAAALLNQGKKKRKKKLAFGISDGFGSNSGSESEDGTIAGSRGMLLPAKLARSMEAHPEQFAAEMRQRIDRHLGGIGHGGGKGSADYFVFIGVLRAPVARVGADNRRRPPPDSPCESFLVGGVSERCHWEDYG